MSIEFVHFKCKNCIQPLFTVKNTLIQINDQGNILTISNFDLRQVFCYECSEILGIQQSGTNKIEFFLNKLLSTAILGPSNNWH